MNDVSKTRRRFVAHFAQVGLGTTLVPGILWARMQETGSQKITLAMVTDALKLAGLEMSEADRETMVNAANTSLTRYEELHKLHIPNDVSPPFHFNPIVPGMEVNRVRQPFRMSTNPTVKRPTNLEEVAFWPVRHLAELVRTKQVSSVELTQMYLARLHRYNPTLNCVVTFLDDLGMAQAKQADDEIEANRYKGPLHGIPWGAKDIISVKGYKTTWGSGAYTDQVFDYDASIVEMLRDAGAVLIAKLSTGEMASGDTWFGGQTKSPWDPTQGSSGSSAGPGSATSAGCVGFAIGTETSGSILGPSSRNGLAGLRPTFGRISRYGVMALSWTQDRLGPMCRYAEDCALVMQTIAKPDGRDMSVADIPFNWNAQLDIKKLRVGYVKESFDEITNQMAKQNAQKLLDTLTSIGVSKFVPLTIPEFPYDVSSHPVEEGVFFDEMVRSGLVNKMTRKTRGDTFKNARVIPAVEYLQSQRARMMMMMKLHEATANVDVYIVAGNGFSGGTGAGARGAAPVAAPPRSELSRSAAQRHSGFANYACYPALNIMNGLNEQGMPTNVTFFARPFGEMELLALGKAYQDAAQLHMKLHPTKMEA
jgi:Asp-tRNA(Asn)/Glu-tRNA(Gln) amidotransferase A subunit family amidase